jgi:hypothetical protein
MPDEKLKNQDSDQSTEEAPCSVVEPASGHMTLTETSGVWSVFAAYFPPNRADRGTPASEISAWRDEDDFSAEHGYEPGFEGRSEFEHGEFERWV